MKNIAQYFEDSVKSCSNTAIVVKGNEAKEKDPKGKRNRVKIKISRTNTKEQVCNIIESSSDMIDKTPSPFRKINKANKSQHETPKRSSLSKLSMSTKHKNLTEQHLSYLALETNDFNKKKKKKKQQSKQDHIENAERESHDKRNSKTNVNVNDKLNGKKTVDIELINLDSDDEVESGREESNAFQILMSRNKPAQCASPMKFCSQNEELNGRRTEEYKEKLKHTKEKLTALADKKGYNKRKLAEMEEDDEIEQRIQNRIKLLKGEERKSNNTEATVVNRKQPAGSLLNYFSKTPVDLVHTNMTSVTTIVVKADVHVAEDVKYNLCKSNSNNRIQPVKKNKKSNLDFSQMDDIRIVESENINICSNKKRQQDEQQHNKRRWSLRIKLQTYENENATPDESSDEEIFSPRSKVKLNAENRKKLKNGVLKSIDSENLPAKDKNKKGTSKRANEQMKLELKKREHLDGSDYVDAVQDDKYIKKKTETKHGLVKLGKCESVLTQDKNSNSCDSTDVKNIVDKNSKLDKNKEECMMIRQNISKRKTTDKLAPLFTKRRKPDPEVLAARRLFLQPDITDNSAKTPIRKVNINGILPFPLISHVTQLSNSKRNKTNSFNIPKEIYREYSPSINANNFKQLINFDKKQLKTLGKVTKPKVQEVLTEIEKYCSNAREMWDVISLAVKKHLNKSISPRVRAKKQSERTEKTENKSKEDQFEYCSWTYKYRPKCSQEVVGNEEAVKKLREWILRWKANFTNEDASSEDEFYSSDSNHSRISENNQVAVLLGPHGCGKTASVYAVAEEYGYTVLELNASSKRTGKKILKELEEATKSHRIKKDEKTTTLSNFTVSDETVPKKIPQNSLILIEDVDIVFEEDEGFISASYQLASNSKRPIVMTSRDVCPHLNKMAPQQNRIYFQDAIGNRVPALLELISLAETGYRLPSHYITELLQNGDLRKAILQLQYLLLSGPPRVLEQIINFKNSFWQNMQHHVYKPAIKASKKWKRKKVAVNEAMTNDKSILIDVASRLNSIALISSLTDVEDPALNLWQVKMQPSLSLIENIDSYSGSNNICLEIAEWIGGKVTYKDQLNECDGIQYRNTTLLRKQLNKGVNLALSQTTSLLLDRQIMATDYLPSIRTICRAEELRANTNNKRGNRFFHYLHSLRAPSILLKSNILTAACKMMCENDKNDNSMQTGEYNNNL